MTQQPPSTPSDDAVGRDESRVQRWFGRSAAKASEGDDASGSDVASQMRANRRISGMRRQAASTDGGGGSVQFATGRPRDPLFYWKQNNLPYEYNDPQELARIRMYCRLLYISHPLIASCIDIYAKYPLLGVELKSKNPDITQFYTDLFFSDAGLNYEEFLPDFGREYWIAGEVWPLGSFNETLGVWEDEELLNPDDIEVAKSPFLREPRFFIRLPEKIRDVIKNRTPAWEYAKLMEAYPELVAYSDDSARMPVSNILLRQYMFKADTFSPRGLPILMRAMRSVMQEEMLNAAMDAIADRLYTPLILVKLGASATDLGTTVPWVPTQDDLEDFLERFDMAMAGDFRVLANNFAIEIESVFGRDQMPDLNVDFERLEDKILQSFGLSRTMLTGASAGETYAADALNRDLVSQLLTGYQKMIARHFRQRALVVAEAQGHYDYDERDGKRFVKTEEILEVDEETGEERIVEQPKLLIPDLVFRTMNLQNEESEREFLETLRASGVPISIKTRMMNLPVKLDDEIEQSRDEQIQLAVAEQETRKGQYLALRAAGLPIPSDLRADFDPMASVSPQGATEGQRTPVLGIDPTVTTPNVAPTPDDIAGDQTEGVAQPGMPGVPVDADPTQQDQSQVPPESNEMRENMPKAAALEVIPLMVEATMPSDGDLWRGASRIRRIAAAHYTPPSGLKTRRVAVLGEDGKPTGEQAEHYEDDGIARGAYAAPKHVGARRHDAYAVAHKDTPMDEWDLPQD